MKIIMRLKQGFFSYFEAIGVLFRRPALFRYILIPFLINLGVYAGVLYAAFHYFSPLMGWFLAAPTTWYGYLLYYAVAAILVFSILFVIVLSFTLVGNLIASPFCDLLSEKIASQWEGEKQEERAPFLWKAKRVLLTEIKKMIFLVFLGICAFFLNIIPFLGLFGAFLITLLVAFEYFDYNFSRQRWNLRERIRFMLGHLPEAIGFGLAAALALTIPLLNFFAIPLAVIGGTLIFCRSLPGKVSIFPK